MTTTNLISKLNRNNIPNSILNINGYNKDVVFTINGIIFYAGFEEGKNIIIDYCRNIGYNDCSQETDRIFFDNFNQVLRHANN